MNKLNCLLLVLIAFTSSAFAEPCPSATLCPTLLKQTAACGKWYSETKCDPFVETYQKLADRYDCKRAADAKPVPAIWMCDTDGGTPHPSEKAAALLAKLKTTKARDFFASSQFRSTLEGESAEHWMKRSVSAAEKKGH